MVDMMLIYLSGFFVNLHTRANYLKEKIFLMNEAPLISNHEMCAIYQLVQVEIDTELCLFKIFVSLLTVLCFYARIP